MRKKTCCVTGHRNLPQREINYVKAALRREIDRAAADGYTCFISGLWKVRSGILQRSYWKRRKRIRLWSLSPLSLIESAWTD